MSIKNKVKDASVIVIFLILALWLSPFILFGLVFYLIHKIRQKTLRKKLLEQIEKDWFANGKYVFFLYSDSKKWKTYFEEKLIPKIKQKAVVWNWSTRIMDGWQKDILEAKILSAFRPAGYFYPMAIVFLPNGEVKIFQFYTAYVAMIKSGQNEYDKMEKEFLTLVNSIR